MSEVNKDKFDYDAFFKNVKSNLAKRKIKVTTASDPQWEVKIVPVGIPEYDDMLSGGYTRGGLHMITGESKTGKTTVAVKAIAHAQTLGLVCGYVDAERRLDPPYFQKLGVDLEKLMYHRPTTGEEAVEVIMEWLDQGFDLIVVDSFAALVPESEYKSEGADAVKTQQIGVQARLLDKAIKLFIPRNKKTVLIGLNQYRTNISVTPFKGLKDIMPGGRAQYYNAHTIVELRHSKWMFDKPKGAKDRKIIGYVMQGTLMWSLHSIPRKICHIAFEWSSGRTEIMETVLERALDKGVIDRRGPMYDFSKIMGEKKLFKGINAMKEFLTENPDSYEALKTRLAEMDEHWKEQVNKMMEEDETPEGGDEE